MTEAGKRWALDKSLSDSWETTIGDTYGGVTAEAEFWIRAFVALVEKRADKWRTPGESQSPAVPVFNALNEVTKELLGE